MKAEWSNKDSLEMPTTTTSDYIKREDAIKEANTWSMFGNDNLESRLKRLPSADVVEVIRCENCEFWDKDENILGGICDEWSDFEDSIISYTKPDDYCSKGERKEEENESRSIYKK